MRFNPFFQDGPAKDNEYINLRDLPCFREAKQAIESDWALYCQLELQDLGNKQPNEAKEHFHGVFWELFLACSLHNRGYSLFKPGTIGSGGPDLGFVYQNKRVYLEAIASTSGNPSNPDSPTLISVYQDEFAELLSPSEDGLIRTEPLILRLTNAFSEKKTQYEKWRSPDKENTCYVIAINAQKISHYIKPIDICRAVFGIGALVQDSAGRMFYEMQDSIVKNSGAQVPLTLFRSNQASTISGILYSTVDCLNRNNPLTFIPNPNAINLVPNEAFGFCQQYHLVPSETGFSLHYKASLG